MTDTQITAVAAGHGGPGAAAGRRPRPGQRDLSWQLLLRGVQLEQIRGDHVRQEAFAVRADPLHLAAVFHLSSATAIA